MPETLNLTDEFLESPVERIDAAIVRFAESMRCDVGSALDHLTENLGPLFAITELERAVIDEAISVVRTWKTENGACQPMAGLVTKVDALIAAREKK